MARKPGAAVVLLMAPLVVLLVTLLMTPLVTLLVRDKLPGAAQRSCLAPRRVHPIDVCKGTTGKHLALLFHVEKLNLCSPQFTPP